MLLSAQQITDNTKFWLDFFAKIVDTLAWPIVFLIVFFIFYFNRKSILKNSSNILKLLKYTKSVKLGNAEISFSDQLYLLNVERMESNHSSTENNQNKEPEQLEDSIKQKFSSEDKFNEIALSMPDLAILDSWRVVEKEIIETFNHFNFEPNINRTSDYVMLKILFENGKISNNQFLFISRLKSLRNELSHNFNSIISYSDAETYRKNCFEAIQILQNSLQN